MRIPIEELAQGMIIYEDIYNSGGSLIINNGFSVQNVAIVQNILRQNDVKTVKVLILPAAEEESEIQKQVRESIHHEIESFHEDFRHRASQINEKLKSENRGIDSDFLQKFLEEALEESKDNYLNIFQLIQKTKAMEDYIFSHCYTVALTARRLGEWLKLKESELKELTLSALLSAIGKTLVSEEILNKKGSLSDSEMAEMRKYPDYSLKLLENIPLSRSIHDGIRFHHERSDGSGYPMGLAGDNIPLFARIIAVADVYVALTSNRPHRRMYTPFEAMHIMESDFRHSLDITILTTFLKKISGSYIGNPVVLSDGQKGRIIFMPPHNYARPVVKIDGTSHLVDLSLAANRNLHIAEFQ